MPPKNTRGIISSSRPCAILLCYHFHPSSAVASRRVGAVSKVLASSELDVWVVSAFGGASFEIGEEISPNVRALAIPDPRRLLIPWLVLLKRLITQRTRLASDDYSTIGNVSGSTGGERSSTWLSRLKGVFLASLDVVDSQKKWAMRAAQAALSAAVGRNVQLVVASGPPHSGLVAACYVARRLRVPLIADFRDPFAAGREDFGRAGPLARAVQRYLERWLVSRAAAITATTPGITSALRDSYPGVAEKVQLVFNGFDGEPAQRGPSTGHRLNIVFAGELYVRRDPFPVLAAVESLLSRPDVDPQRVAVRFIGQCATFDGRSLSGWLQGTRAASVVSLIPEIPMEQLRPYLQEATVMLNLAQGQQTMIPAKTFEHLASGREILAICEADSDTGRLLESIPGIIRITPGDQEALNAALADLYERHVVNGLLRQIAPEDVQRYSRAAQNEVFRKIVSSVLNR